MRAANDSVWTRSLGSVLLVLAAIGLTASSAVAETVHLIAAPVTKLVALPNGDFVSVPMWGYALDKQHVDGDGNVVGPNGALDADEPVTVPGPRIVVPVDGDLTITLTNLLPEATSLVIPGQPFKAVPERNADGRIMAMTPETAPTLTKDYIFTDLKPGTFLYQSGSHPAVQVQMGLYGAMTKDQSAGNAYAGVAYAHEAVLVYSEIDQALHEAVEAETYGTPNGPTSTIDYKPSLFLINGESYTHESMAMIEAGTAGEATLLRILNAGLRTHAPVLDNGNLSVVAEDGNKLPFAKSQATVMLAAGKTHDVLWVPPASGVYSLYDRMLSLNAPGQGAAGMLAKLRVEPVGGPPSGTDGVLVARDDSASGLEDNGAISGNVLSNDSNAASAELVAYTHAGMLTLLGNGTFQYTPGPNFFGVDEFRYRAVNGAQSASALVTIFVTGVPDRPVTSPVSFGVDQGGNVNVTLRAVDPDGDPLTYVLDSAPAHGGLSYIDPLTKVETTAGPGAVVPGGLVIYTAAAAYVGPDSFTFHASDGALSSVPLETASATVSAVDNPSLAELTNEVTLTVRGADGSTIANYRWTLEEDLTYKVTPGTPDPNTLAVRFHSSYMPVVAAGTEAEKPKVNPEKRYFISVLPTENTYSNSGAEIEANQTAATITVAKLPLPTARIRVQVFEDNAPLDGMVSGTEAGLRGFQVTIDDAGGTYGMSGGHQSTDAFGNKIGTTYEPCDPGPCDSYQVTKLGDGFVLTDIDGFATIENLPMGKYTVKVRAPGGDKWIQTTTIEGQPGIDAWVKPNEPQFFTEFGPPGPHVLVGFVKALASIPQGDCGSQNPTNCFRGNGSISGRITNLRMSRPPETTLSSGAPFTHTRPWVALNSAATAGSLIYAQPANEDGTFTIANVKAGNYSLVVFDSALDLIIASRAVDVAATVPTVLGDVPVFAWFSNLYSYVYDDKNGDGHHDSDEPGIADQALNIRFRDGSIYQSLSTDDRGFKAFNEVFPFFAWLVAEVDYTRFHSTGVTVVVDNGGVASASSDWQTQAGLPAGLVPPNVLNPQPQAENGNAPFRTESGKETPFLLLEGFQGFLGQSNVMLWGKAPYEKVGDFVEEVNVYPFDDFPGPGDVDSNGDLYFNTDRSNGGIAGILHYTITRAENDPRWAAAENWEPGVSDVRVQLWDENRTHLLNEVTTDNWNNSLPEGCQGPVFTFLGQATDCYDGLRNFNQARPALFDGGYAFSTVLQATASRLLDGQSGDYGTNVQLCDPGDATANPPRDPISTDCRDKIVPIPAGRYVVKIIVPPGYKVQKEEDKNVDFGDQYIPQQFWLSGYPLADGGPTEAQPAPTVSDNALIAPFCVGPLHEVPPSLTLFPDQVGGAFAGELRPLCDAKLVVLREGQQAAPDFHLLTDAPKAGQVYGMVLDDTTNEFDPNAPTFGEKYAPPYMPIAFRDWQGREVARTYTDQYGMYNALVPATYTIQVPQPSGVAPSILQACINAPTMPDPNNPDRVIADPLFQKQYSHFCYPLQYLPGKTTYLDTPVLPTGAFTGTGTFPVDAELPNRTPIVASVNGPLDLGPYIVDTPDDATRTIVLRSAGPQEVPNPAYGGAGSPEPKLITRDYGFGSQGGFVTLGGQRIPYLSWSDTEITAVVPTLPASPTVAQAAQSRTGELAVERCLAGKSSATNTVNGTCNDGRKSVLGVTLNVATPAMHDARPPKVVPSGAYPTIQSAIDHVHDGAKPGDPPSTQPGDLILVKPGTYEEMVVMTKPVRLQGAGALSTIINVVTPPSENVQAWLDYVGQTLLAHPDYLLPNQPAMTPAPFQPGDVANILGDEGAGVTVLGKDQATDLGVCRGGFFSPANDAYCLQNENSTGAEPVSITGLTRSGPSGNRRANVATSPVAHHFVTGDQITIAGVSPGAYNGTFSVTVTDATHFNYAVSGNPSSNINFSSGTARKGPLPAVWRRPNARIDGFSLVGANSAPGLLANGNNRYLEVSNNKIHTNTGTYAGGIQLGHAGSLEMADENAHIWFAAIHNNLVSQNASNEPNGGGGIVLGTGVGMYRVLENFIAANFTGGQGAGIAHIGNTDQRQKAGEDADGDVQYALAPDRLFELPTYWGPATDVPSNDTNVGVIDRNTIVFNESFNQGAATNGGGIFVGGTPPAAAGDPQVGSGNVRISNNLIQGNSAAGGDGGGVALVGTASQLGNQAPGSNVVLYNNIIANNVAAFAGGGISLQDAGSWSAQGGQARGPEIVHNTIVHNDSLATAGLAFVPSNPNQSAPMPAGIFVRNNSGNNPKITNSIVWQNRSFYFGLTADGLQIPGTTAHYGLLPCALPACTADGYWDTGRSGNPGTLLSNAAATTAGDTTSTAGTPPSFVKTYFNGDRRSSYQQTEVTTILVPAALDEGGNFIRPQFGPLSLTQLDDTRFSNYHIKAGVDGIPLNSNTNSGGYGNNGNVPPALLSDIDREARASTPDRGADEVLAGLIPPPIAVNDVASTPQDVPVTIPVLTNDEAATPASGQPLIVTGVSLLVGGTAATDGTTVTYTPDPGFGGQGSFVYSISGVGGEASATVVVNVGTPAAFLSLAPATLNFGTVTQLETSPPKVVTVSNTGNDTMTITSIVLGGAVDQYQAINSCPATLASGASCTVSVTFKPTSIGAKLATLDVNVGAPATSGSVSLSGIGLGTALTAAPGTLTFGPQTLNQSSPAQFVTLTNSGNLLAEFSATLSGPDASQFTPLSGGCPAMPPPSTNRFVAAGGSCTAGVTFRPTTTGSKNAKLLLTPTVGTLAPVTLTGTGAAASVTRTPSSLSFGNVQLGTASTPQAVTITNNGGAPVQLALSIASSQFSQTGTCPVAPAALASGANCVANVRFVPTGSTGTKNGTLTVTPIGNNSLQQTVGLSGTASSFSPPVITAPAPTGSGTPLSGSVPLSATLLGTNGVNRVQFLVAGTVVATDTDLTDGVTGVWNTRFQDNGTRIITARACGNSNCNGNNLLGTSAGVSVTVNNTLSLTAPASGPVSGPVSLAASLTATNGVNRVQFLVGNNVITFDGSPFPGNTATGVWNTTVANNGPRVIRARACGNNSCSTVLATSADVSVTVGN